MAESKGAEIVPINTAKLSRIEDVASRCKLVKPEDRGVFEHAAMVAAGMNELRQLVDKEVMQYVMPLQGSSIGFRTDRDHQQDNGYGQEVVRDCLIEATIRGVRPVGNEFNIIGSRCYLTKEGLRRLVLEWPGLTNLQILPGLPKMVGDKGAVIHVKATWVLRGKSQSIETDFPIRVNAGMGGDAIRGKAERKVLKAIHDQLTGQSVPEGDVDDMEPVDVTDRAKELELRQRLEEATNGEGA